MKKCKVLLQTLFLLVLLLAVLAQGAFLVAGPSSLPNCTEQYCDNNPDCDCYCPAHSACYVCGVNAWNCWELP